MDVSYIFCYILYVCNNFKFFWTESTYYDGHGQLIFWGFMVDYVVFLSYYSIIFCLIKKSCFYDIVSTKKLKITSKKQISYQKKYFKNILYYRPENAKTLSLDLQKNVRLPQNLKYNIVHTTENYSKNTISIEKWKWPQKYGILSTKSSPDAHYNIAKKSENYLKITI